MPIDAHVHLPYPRDFGRHCSEALFRDVSEAVKLAQGAGVTGGELAPRHHLCDGVRQMEEPQGVGHGGAGFVHRFGGFLLREAVGFHQGAVALGFFHGVEILPLEILNKGQLSRFFIAHFPDDHRHLSQAGHAGSPPAAFARHQLIAAAGHRADQQGLKHAVLGNGGGELGERFVVKLLAGLGPVGLDFGNGKGNGFPLLLNGVFGEQDLQALAEAPFFRCHSDSPLSWKTGGQAARRPGYRLPHSSLARASYAAAPREPPS